MMTDNQPAIDSCITPFWRTELEPHQWMPEPWASKRHLPGILRQMYSAPTGIPPYGEYLEAARPEGDPAALPGSDIGKVLSKMDSDGSRLGVLTPLTRGPQPDLDMSSVLCGATNDWLARTWLDAPESNNRFLGTIRVNPADPDAAVAEIERWADHPGMVQVGVPLDAWRPYGQRNYFRIWETASRYELPVVVHADGGAAANYKPTMSGYPRKHIDFASQESISAMYHVSSFILEGVFERLPNLRVYFADGCHDFLIPFIWRMDADWAISRHEVPWLTKETEGYIDRLRFRTNHLEGPDEPSAEWHALSRSADLLMFGSNFPHWTTTSTADVIPGLSDDDRRRILWDNAADLYLPRLRKVGRDGLLADATAAESTP
jgi:predicted TIM-barrel fold metal-dependent hydrolase